MQAGWVHWCTAEDIGEQIVTLGFVQNLPP